MISARGIFYFLFFQKSKNKQKTISFCPFPPCGAGTEVSVANRKLNSHTLFKIRLRHPTRLLGLQKRNTVRRAFVGIKIHQSVTVTPPSFDFLKMSFSRTQNLEKSRGALKILVNFPSLARLSRAQTVPRLASVTPSLFDF